VKDEGNLLPFGSDLDDPVYAKARAGGQGVKRRPAVVRRWVSIDDLSGTAGINPAASVRERTANRRELVDRTAKSELVTTLGEVFKATKVVVVAHYSGLTVAQMQTLRRQMKQAGASVKVAKNRLAKIALEGSDVASIGSLLKGPALIAYSGDPIAAPKVAVDFAKTHEQFVILGGAMGTTTLDPNGVKALAALPSLDELRAKLIGLLMAPATKIAQVVTAPAAKVARVVQAYASKSEEGAAA
jgi:large subunit ribosomal protein L10